jgi:hypothetical protein
MSGVDAAVDADVCVSGCVCVCVKGRSATPARLQLLRSPVLQSRLVVHAYSMAADALRTQGLSFTGQRLVGGRRSAQAALRCCAVRWYDILCYAMLRYAMLRYAHASTMAISKPQTPVCMRHAMLPAEPKLTTLHAGKTERQWGKRVYTRRRARVLYGGAR